MKRSRIAVCAVLVVAGFLVSGFFPSGRVDRANTASAALLPEGQHIGAVAGDVPESAKEGEGGMDGTAQVPADSQPHEAGPRDPWMPRPTIRPPGAMEHSGPWTRGFFKSIQVNVDVDGNNIVGDAANEPSIAIDPTNPDNIVIGWRQFDSVESNFRQAGYAYSHDGGQTWTFPGVLQPGVFRSDPVLSFDADGLFYYYSLNENFTCHLFRSLDGGETWTDPVFALGGDKPWMTVDATDGAGRGHIYSIWGRSAARSVDGGLSFEGSFWVPAARGHLTVGLEGVVYAVEETWEGASIVSRSLNARDPDQRPSFEELGQAEMGGVSADRTGPNPGGLLGTPWIAVDHSDGQRRGNLYILGSVDPPGPDPLDVMFVRSTDGGRTWSDPVRVNDDSPNTNAWQWFGTMSVAPNGRIDAVWNDTRNTGVVQWSETFYAYSIDGGLTWTRNMPVSPVWDSRVGWPNQNKIGDYYHMISNEDAANLAYAATLNGEQDVYFLRLGDCNANGRHDSIDIEEGTSEDCTGNGVPDECEPDCNENGIADTCDILAGTSNDCNLNEVPDECEDTDWDPFDGFALAFENRAARVIVSDFDGFPTDEITVSQWLRTSDTSREAGIFSYAVPEEDDEFLILDARNLSLFINGGAVQTGVAVTDGDWHHIALTWASADGVGRLYVDGIDRFSDVVMPGHTLRPDGTVVLADDQNIVGGRFDSRRALIGTIDELRVWNVVRSGEEIRADMRRRLNGDEPGLVSYWRFDEGEGATAEDIAGDNDGEVFRPVWIETFDEFCGCVRDPQWQCDGDVDGDGQVNPVDTGLIQANFCGAEACSSEQLCQYDLDCDEQINPVDSGIVQSLFGTCEKPRDGCP